MIDPCFVDANVFVYAINPAEPLKQEVALSLIGRLWREQRACTSVQAINEFYAVVTRKLRHVIPQEQAMAQMDDLLRRIETLARQSNLAIQGFKPSPSVTKQMHAEWPIALQLDGTYHNLAMFFDRVSKFSRIINVSNIAIRSKEKPLPNSTISVDCVATTFVLLETAKPAAPGAKAN